MTRTIATYVMFLCFMRYCCAQDDSLTRISFLYECGIEYLAPTNSNRQIDTWSGNLFAGVQFFEKCPLRIYGGLTMTHANGEQLDDQKTGVVYYNNVAGAGPVCHMRFEPFIYKGLSFSGDASGGIIFYTEDFPVGGDFYNFMWRRGFSLNYHFNNMFALNLNFKWMHVSNGQGLGPQNPSYEGKGFGLALSGYFK